MYNREIEKIEEKVSESPLYKNPVIAGSELRGSDRQELESLRGEKVALNNEKAAILAKEDQRFAFTAGVQSAKEAAFNAQIAQEQAAQEQYADIGMLDSFLDNSPNWATVGAAVGPSSEYAEPERLPGTNLLEEEGLAQLTDALTYELNNQKLV